MDEDAVLDEVEKVLGVGRVGEEEEEEEEEGGWLIDWHACDVFPKSWLDLVVVLRCTRTEVLWDRLSARCVDIWHLSFSFHVHALVTVPALYTCIWFHVVELARSSRWRFSSY